MPKKTPSAHFQNYAHVLMNSVNLPENYAFVLLNNLTPVEDGNATPMAGDATPPVEDVNMTPLAEEATPLADANLKFDPANPDGLTDAVLSAL